MSQSTPAQNAAIDARGNLVIVAGPGSGKTATVVKRIAKILREPDNRACAVTFSREGANELRHRLEALLTPAQTQRLTVGTFHSLTISLLKQAKPNLRICNPQQQSMFLRSAVDEDGDIASSEAWLAFETIKSSLDPKSQPRAKERWFQSYEERLRRSGMVDLFDVMRMAVQGFADGSVKPSNCTHLVVDEFQDTDPLQSLWIKAHAHANTTIVGDDDQTIYEWRNAVGFPGMVEFQQRTRAELVLLERNFRSHHEIVAAASALIAHNDPYRNKKRLVAHKGMGGAVRCVVLGSHEQEAPALEQLISPDLIGEVEKGCRGVPAGRWAILARTNIQLDEVETSLVALGIRCWRNKPALWTKQEAQVVLQILDTAFSGEIVGVDIALTHAGASTADVSYLLESVKGPAQVRELINHPVDGTAGLENPALVSGVMGELRKISQAAKSADGFERALSLACAFTLREIESQAGSSKSAKQRVHNANGLLRALQKILLGMKGSGAQRVRQLLSDRGNRHDPTAVQLHTMHSCKGMEFDRVAVIGVEQANIPGDALPLPPQSPLLKPGESTIASERRLMYVAMTRARMDLTLLYSVGDPSIFIAELPPDVPKQFVQTRAPAVAADVS